MGTEILIDGFENPVDDERKPTVERRVVLSNVREFLSLMNDVYGQEICFLGSTASYISPSRNSSLRSLGDLLLLPGR